MSFLLQHLLIETARKFPDKEAVVYNEQSISYRELDEITSKLAHVLRENGVERGDRVGIYINKSIPAVVSTQAILKAGGVYVPLDPNAPPKRLAYIVQNCGIKCLLTSTGKAGLVNQLFPEDCPLDVVVITDDDGEPKEQPLTKVVSWQEVANYEDASLPQNLSIETDLAYILYTSGSTGDPKGVMISHLNALTFVNWAFDTYDIKPEDRLSNHAPLHFDLSIFDIFA